MEVEEACQRGSAPELLSSAKAGLLAPVKFCTNAFGAGLVHLCDAVLGRASKRAWSGTCLVV